jgi:transposase InsO family protein
MTLASIPINAGAPSRPAALVTETDGMVERAEELIGLLQDLVTAPGGIGFQLYVVLDIFSRYVVAWTVQAVEDSGITKTTLEEAWASTGSPRRFMPTGAAR